MKKLLASILATAAVLMILPATAFADNGQTIVAGTVTLNSLSGSPVSGATVTVVCDGNTQISPPTTVAGAYTVNFSPASLCPNGATAQVTAVKGSDQGNASGQVNEAGDSGINIAILPVVVNSVPEMGVIASVVAAIAAGGAFLVIRRHNSSANVQ